MLGPVSYTHLDVYKRQPLARSIFAEWHHIISHPINTLKSKPWATKNTIGMVIPSLVTSRLTCCFIVLFCLPVSPIIAMLLMGSVGIFSVLDSCILFNSVLSIKEMFAPVSIITAINTPCSFTLMYTMLPFGFASSNVLSSNKSVSIFFR